MGKYKLKKGDRVWVKIPINATILRVNKKNGYTLKPDNTEEICYFSDEEVQKIEKSKGA